MKIAENIAVLPILREGMGALNLVLAWDSNSLVLVDAGLPGQADEIKAAIAAEGFGAEDLTHIIITHQDWDHIGCVNELAPPAKVVAHAEEAPYIDGRTMPIKLAARLAQYHSTPEAMRPNIDRWKNMFENNPITVAQEVTDGQVLPICGGIEIIHVPGHTPGHIAVHMQASGIIICGDAANITDGKITGSNPIHTHNMPQAEASLEKIKNRNPKGIVAYHTGFLPLC
ncbi:MAG: MBL fold metallo-hydrolase [Defluviitaleaceae bacterium]|nr:MBL fold metallo-hydrolase [Defluviitaleaceae bacterium]